MNSTNFSRFIKNKTLINGALFSIFSFINRGFSFVLLLILANYIAPAEYGYLSLFNTVVTVLGYFIAMSSHGYMTVSYFREGENGIKLTFSSILFITLVMLCFLTIVILSGGDFIASCLHLPSDILFFAVLISFFSVFNHVLLDYFRIRERVKTYGLISCSNAFLNFCLSIFLVKLMMLNWQGRVYAQLACLSVYGFASIVFYVKNGYFTIDIKNHLKPLLLWSIPIIPHLATSFIRQGCDRYIINATHTIEDVGLFSFALNLTNIIIMLGQGFNQSNSVDIYKTLGDLSLTNNEKSKVIKKKTRMFLLIYLLIASIVSLAGYFFVPLILPQYLAAMGYFLILSLYGLLVCIYTVYTNYLFFYKKTRNLMFITFCSSLLHLLLSLFLTQYSLIYTAFLYGFTQLIVVVLVRRKAYKLLKENIDYDC